ncbi:hypothetical protein IPA_03270 [Ignicoccus pacificus DSM 13166]|uniref:Uncharacterized protein n=1 Tax=Ignicoccus pacificus DSM 13166 TaxID=940294 RepID=A0A977PKS8_9CREN|nr:hypothetical protein IPA_03270 [Ignicoccus pacificus DSM 13166]
MIVVTIYSVVLVEAKGVKHCDMTVENGRLKLELLGERLRGKSRRGLSKQMDLLLYKLEKEKRKNYGKKEVILDLSFDDIRCWRIERHTGKGIAREYQNTFVFIIRTKDGKEYKMLVSDKVFKMFIDKVIKQFKRAEIEKCSFRR